MAHNQTKMYAPKCMIKFLTFVSHTINLHAISNLCILFEYGTNRIIIHFEKSTFLDTLIGR